MLQSLRRLPCRATYTCIPRRNLTFTAARQAEIQENNEVAEDTPDRAQSLPVGKNSAEMLENFLRDSGTKFKTPAKPNNWLGGDRVELFRVIRWRRMWLAYALPTAISS